MQMLITFLPQTSTTLWSQKGKCYRYTWYSENKLVSVAEYARLNCYRISKPERQVYSWLMMWHWHMYFCLVFLLGIYLHFTYLYVRDGPFDFLGGGWVILGETVFFFFFWNKTRLFFFSRLKARIFFFGQSESSFFREPYISSLIVTKCTLNKLQFH